MTIQTETLLNAIDCQIESKHLLKHDFYQAWTRGELSLECLREYAKEYYHHVKAFPTYLSAVHSHTEDSQTRKILLNNLIEEESDSSDHPQLWKQFALSLGVTEEEITQHTPNAEIAQLISTFRSICGEQSTAEGIAALYAYESQIPAVCVSKIQGLKAHYGMKNPSGWEYFRVHIAADEQHAAEERALLAQYVNGNNGAMVQAAVDKVLDSLNSFLTGLCHRYEIACA